ncbi:MAG: hypothetical protein KDB53_00025, partial [Planctomycetes bacterium]|nr:hypothetical protein [Planctomycetota bacterium]
SRRAVFPILAIGVLLSIPAGQATGAAERDLDDRLPAFDLAADAKAFEARLAAIRTERGVDWSRLLVLSGLGGGPLSGLMNTLQATPQIDGVVILGGFAIDGSRAGAQAARRVLEAAGRPCLFLSAPGETDFVKTVAAGEIVTVVPGCDLILLNFDAARDETETDAWLEQQLVERAPGRTIVALPRSLQDEGQDSIRLTGSRRRERLREQLSKVALVLEPREDGLVIDRVEGRTWASLASRDTERGALVGVEVAVDPARGIVVQPLEGAPQSEVVRMDFVPRRRLEVLMAASDGAYLRVSLAWTIACIAMLPWLLIGWLFGRKGRA